jgi:hypothetical protein
MSLVTVSVKALKWPEEFARLADQLLIRVHGLPPPCRDEPRGAYSGSEHACGHATIPVFPAAPSARRQRVRLESAPTNPATFAISTLLFPADRKNAPCSAKIGVAHKLLKKLVDFIAKDRLSLQFAKISLQIANCREERPARDLFASDCILSHAVGSLRTPDGFGPIGAQRKSRVSDKRLPRLHCPSRRIAVSTVTLIAASDLLHAPVITSNRHCPAAGAPTLISIGVTVPVMALSPTRPAHVNPHAARTDGHTLSNGRCRSSGSQCPHHSKHS